MQGFCFFICVKWHSGEPETPPPAHRALWLAGSNTAAHKHRAAANMRFPTTEVPAQDSHKEKRVKKSTQNRPDFPLRH